MYVCMYVLLKFGSVCYICKTKFTYSIENKKVCCCGHLGRNILSVWKQERRKLRPQGFHHRRLSLSGDRTLQDSVVSRSGKVLGSFVLIQVVRISGCVGTWLDPVSEYGHQTRSYSENIWLCWNLAGPSQ